MWQDYFDSAWFSFFFPFLLFLFIGGGILFAIKYKKKKKWEASGIENSIVAIFGLIISFTFLMAGNAHKERYSYIHEEANAADLLYRYSKEINDSFALNTKDFLVNFLNNQLNYNSEMQNSEQLLLTSATELADDYWVYINNYKKNSNPDTIIKVDKIAELFNKMKTAFLLHAYSYDERTPGAVLFLLIITALLIGFLIGFMNGVKPHIHFLLPVIYFVMISLIMLVIRDLNNPLKGSIRPNYHNLTSTFKYIKNN